MPSLIDKYRPKSFGEFLGNRKQIEELRNLIKSNSKVPIMVYGPIGVGKNLALELIAKELGYEIIHLSASDFRDYESIKQTIFQSSRQQSLFSKGKIMLIDELDIIDNGMTRGLKEIIDGSGFPVILMTTNPYEKNIQDLRKACVLVKFDRVRYDVIAKFLREICEKEGINYDEIGMNQLARIVDGDVRAAIMDLEALGNVTEKSVLGLGDRTYEQPIFETVKIMFKARRIENSKLAVEQSEKTPDEIFWWLEENIFREYSTPQEIADAYQFLAKADYFQSMIIRRQSWGLQKYFIDMLCSLSLAKQQPGRGFIMYQPPRFFGRIGKKLSAKSNGNGSSSFVEKLCSSTHTSRKIASQYLPLLRKMSAVKNREKFAMTAEEADIIKAL